VFSTEALREALERDADDPESRHDMGGNIVPSLVGRGEAGVYDFSANVVPGETERDHGYWRDVGTIDAYYEAHRDLISTHPIFNLYNSDWPISRCPRSGRRPSSSTAVRRRSPWSARVASCPARRWCTRCSPPGCTWSRARWCRTRCCPTACGWAPARWSPGDPGQERGRAARCAPRRGSGSGPGQLPLSDGGVVVLGKGTVAVR